MHAYWFVLICQMAKALVIESNMDRDIRSEAEFSPNAFDENSNTDDSQATAESSQQSVVQSQMGLPQGGQYVVESNSQIIQHRKAY